jgi:hypothetical protein
MRRKTILALIFVFAVAIAAFLLPALVRPKPALAQDPCQAFHAVLQEELPTDIQLRPGDTWGGGVYATLGQEVLLGLTSGNDGTQSIPGTTIISKGGSYKYDFGGGNTFTAEANTSPAQLLPHGPFFGKFRNSQRITEGEGRFQYASGNLELSGPFIIYSFAPLHGRFNGEVSGNICGVQPPE